MRYLISLALIITPAFLVYSQKTQASVSEDDMNNCEQNRVACSCNSKAPSKAPSDEPRKGCGCGNKACRQ